MNKGASENVVWPSPLFKKYLKPANKQKTTTFIFCSTFDSYTKL